MGAYLATDRQEKKECVKSVRMRELKLPLCSCFSYLNKQHSVIKG